MVSISVEFDKNLLLAGINEYLVKIDLYSGYKSANVHSNIRSRNIMTNKPIRQGSLMLVPVDKVPEGKVEQHKSAVLEHSESGHNHVLTSPEAFETITVDEDNVFVRLMTTGVLTHQKPAEKHEELEIAPRTYKLVHKNEYKVFDRLMKRVVD